MKKLLDLLQKRRLQDNKDQIKWQSFQQWLRRGLIGHTSGVADAEYKPLERYVNAPD